MRRPRSSTTGRRLTCSLSISRAAAAMDVPDRTVTDGELIRSAAVRPAPLIRSLRRRRPSKRRGSFSPAYSILRSRSASDTTPVTRWKASTTGTALNLCSTRRSTNSRYGAVWETVTTAVVMTSSTRQFFITILPSVGLIQTLGVARAKGQGRSAPFDGTVGKQSYGRSAVVGAPCTWSSGSGASQRSGTNRTGQAELRIMDSPREP